MRNNQIQATVLVSALAIASVFAVPSQGRADGLFIPSDTVSAQSSSPVAGVVRSRTVTIDAQRLPAASGGLSAQSVGGSQQVKLNLFSDLNLSAVVTPESGHLPFEGVRVQSAAAAVMTSAGSIEGDPFSTVSLARRGGGLYGSVITDGRRFRIVPLGNGEHRIDEIDTSYLQDVVEDLLPPSAESADILTALTPRPNEPVDIMILHSAEAINIVRKALKTNEIDHTVLATVRAANMNKIFSISKITTGTQKAFRLVHSAEISWRQKHVLTAVDDLVRSRTAEAKHVTSLREKYGADLVVVVIHQPNGGKRIGKICGYAAGIPKLRQALPNKGFTVVDVTCSIVNSSLDHEVGHLVGAQHDPDAHGGKLRIKGPNRGYVDYSKKLRTVMAYPSGCRARQLKCPRLPVFSNPEIAHTTKKGTVIWKPGTRQNFNAGRIKANLPYIAAYRPQADAKPPTRRRPTAPPVKKRPSSPKPPPPISKAPTVPKTPPKVTPTRPRAPVRSPVRPPATTPPVAPEQPDWKPL